MEFNWDDFKNKKIVVKCNTEEKAKDFLKECEKQGLEWFDGKATSRFYYYDGICYVYKYDGNDYIQYSSEGFYSINGYEVIEWEINKMHYDREYTIQELFNFKEETKFKADNGISYYIKDDDLFKENGEKTDNTIYRILHMKFKLIEKDRKVSFEEAIQAYNKYKEIKCMQGNQEYIFDGENDCLTDLIEEDLLRLILNGEWYIKED